MDIYVSIDGNDSQTGSESSPVASFKKALAILRNSQEETKRLIIREGHYYNAEIELNEQDSGLEITAYPGEKPVLYGGFSSSDWHQQGSLLYLDVDPQQIPEDGIRNLIINDQPCTRSKYPADGVLHYHDVFDVPWMSTTGGGWKRKPTDTELTTMHFNKEELDSSLDIENAEVRVYHQWDESIVGIKSVDWDQGVMTFSSPLGHPPGAFGGHHNAKFQTYHLYNTKHGMKTPGNWYFDRRESRIYYSPKAIDDVNQLTAVVPTREWIIRLNSEESVKDISVSGLVLQATNPSLGYMGFAARSLKGAINIECDADSLCFDSLTIKNTGGKGISVDSTNLVKKPKFCNITVENSHFENCGGTAILLTGSNHVMFNNTVINAGCLHPSAVAVSCGGQDHRIEQNTVDRCPYTAIHGGGTNCLVKANRLMNFMQELDDGAAIYFFGAKSCNYQHNIVIGHGLERCASAYYLDEQSENSVVEYNLAINTGWPNHNHMANNCHIRNNYFIDHGDSIITFPKSTGFTFTNNIVIAEKDISLRHISPETFTDIRGNFFFSKTGKVLENLAGQGGYGSSGEKPFDEPDNLIADPGLILENERVSFTDKSPVLKNAEICPADFSKAGATLGNSEQ